MPLMVTLMSCGLFKKKAEEAPKPSGTSVLGEVTSVHAEQGFVLFRKYGAGELREGGILSARSLDGKTAVDLQLSPEKLGRFYTADFSKEAKIPRKGDLVIRSESSNDTQNDNLSTESVTSNGEKFEKVISSQKPEILDSAASQRSR